MSSIGFHSPAKTVTIHGPERAHAHILCQDMLAMALNVHHQYEYEGHASKLRHLLPMDEQRRIRKEHFASDMLTYMGVSGSFVMPDTTTTISCWHAALNTAIVAGSNPVRFLARVDAQCELHGYVEGHNRAWLADIVEEGLDKNILRRAFDGSLYKSTDDDLWGWQHLITMLREDDVRPVVMSHSSNLSFPDAWMDGITITNDEWYALTDEQRWAMSMEILRSNKEKMLEMAPDNLATIQFGEDISGYDLRAALDEIVVQERQ